VYYNFEQFIYLIFLISIVWSFAVRRFHSLFHSLWSLCDHVNVLLMKKRQNVSLAMKGAFHRSLTVLVYYRFPLHCVIKHQYLAFDVSLPPPNYLSCSPKQLDSGSTFTNYVVICISFLYIFFVYREKKLKQKNLLVCTTIKIKQKQKQKNRFSRNENIIVCLNLKKQNIT